MRINLTLNVGEQTRHAIAQALKLEHPQATRDRRASRKAVIAWLQQQLDTTEAEHLAIFRLEGRLKWSAVDFEEAGTAVAYLHSAGLSDKEIYQWILLQRARFNFPQASARK